MKQAFRKNILRTIRKSFGRYVAILAIIALGVGFFTGLKASKPAMMKTGQEYVQSQRLYDYRLLSTWGFDRGTTAKGSQRVRAGCVLFSGEYDRAGDHPC